MMVTKGDKEIHSLCGKTGDEISTVHYTNQAIIWKF